MNIEKKHSKMTKIIAFALFSVVVFELDERRKNLEKINYKQWHNISERNKDLDKITSSGINASIIFRSANIASLGGPLITAVTSLFSKSKDVDVFCQRYYNNMT